MCVWPWSAAHPDPAEGQELCWKSQVRGSADVQGPERSRCVCQGVTALVRNLRCSSATTGPPTSWFPRPGQSSTLEALDFGVISCICLATRNPGPRTVTQNLTVFDGHAGPPNPWFPGATLHRRPDTMNLNRFSAPLFVSAELAAGHNWGFLFSKVRAHTAEVGFHFSTFFVSFEFNQDRPFCERLDVDILCLLRFHDASLYRAS